MLNKQICCLLILLASFQTAFAQQQNIFRNNPSLNRVEFIKHFEVNQNDNFTIGITPGATDVSWTYCSNTTPQDSCTNYSASPNPSNRFAGNFQLTFDNTNGVINLSGTPTIEGVYSFNFRVTVSGASFVRKYRFIVRDPLQLLFVVDRSGSMECQPGDPGSTTGWPACTTQATDKWEMAKDAVQQFATRMNNTTHTFFNNDEVGIVYFDGEIGSSTISSTATPFTTASNFNNNIVSDFDGQYGTVNRLGINGTGLGQGMNEGANQRLPVSQANSRRQVLILLSDGAQNRGPMVLASGPNAGKELDVPGKTPLRNDPSQAGALDVYTIGFDGNINPGSVGWLMSQISTDASRNYFFTTGVGNYTPSFDEIFARVFQSFSPQLIQSKTQSYTGDAVSDTFQINRGVQMLYFNVSFQDERANRMRYTLTHNGDTIDIAQSTIGEFSAMMTIAAQENPGLDTKGEWILYTKRQPIVDVFDNTATEFNQVTFRQANFSATVDEHQLNIDYAIDNDATIISAGGVRVGTRLRPEVSIAINGRPLTNALVIARLIRPNDDKGDLIARHPATAEIISNSEINNLFTAKFRQIALTDPKYLDSLRLRSDEIVLVHQGNGRYTGRFNPIEVADNLAVKFTVAAEDDYYGAIRRTNTLSVAARFGELEHNLANQTATTQQVDDGFRHDLTYTPAYRVGNRIQLVGPGYENSFGIQGGSINNIQDNGDGSYSMRVTTPERNSRPTMYLLDEPFYKGRSLTQFDEPYTQYPFDLSLHLGFSGPFSNATDLINDGGFMAELDLSYRIIPRISLELIGGYYTHALTDYILGAGLHLRYHTLGTSPSPSSTGLTLAGGIGYYQPNSLGAWEFGYGIRGGVERSINPRLRLLADIGFYSLPSSSLQMGILSVGLKYGL